MKVLGYAKAKVLFRDGTYQELSSLADDIGRTDLAKDLHMNIQTLRKRTNNPGLWSIEELAAFADLMEMDRMVFFKMANDEMILRTERLKKKKNKK